MIDPVENVRVLFGPSWEISIEDRTFYMLVGSSDRYELRAERGGEFRSWMGPSAEQVCAAAIAGYLSEASPVTKLDLNKVFDEIHKLNPLPSAVGSGGSIGAASVGAWSSTMAKIYGAAASTGSAWTGTSPYKLTPSSSSSWEVKAAEIDKEFALLRKTLINKSIGNFKKKRNK